MKWHYKLKILLSLSKRKRQTKNTAAPVTLRNFVLQYILGFNKSCHWPVHISSVISGSQYIKTGIGTAPGLSNGCYIFASKDARITIGDYVIIAPNTCIAGYNHDTFDHREYISKGETIIGEYSWIGMNSIILPGVVLGKHTIVAAGAVVTTSHNEGYVVLAGNPAVVIRQLDPEKCTSYVNQHLYVGYLTLEEYKKSDIYID